VREAAEQRSVRQWAADVAHGDLRGWYRAEVCRAEFLRKFVKPQIAKVRAVLINI